MGFCLEAALYLAFYFLAHSCLEEDLAHGFVRRRTTGKLLYSWQ